MQRAFEGSRSSRWYVLLIIALLVSTLTTCVRVGIRDVYAPTYLSYSDLRATISTADPVELRETGKIYVKDNYIYVNELYRGVHIIDNTDPETPVPVAFLPIPGNVDIAILGTILYADSYVDLVAIDIEDPLNAAETGRVENAFPYDQWYGRPIGEWWTSDEYQTADENEGIVIGWEKIDEKIYFEDSRLLYDVVAMEGGASGTGTGGSLARFTIVDTYLYALHESYMQLFSLANPEAPTLGERVDIAWDIETIFPYGDLLFIGSMTGMYIYDNSNPANPTQLSRFAHVTSCDPVVVQGDKAYVTLRAGSLCGGGTNQLDIIDISDLEDPTLIKSFPMNGPYGLGVDGTTLFICDGISGLRVFDVQSDETIEEIASFETREVFDVILIPPLAIVVGPEGIDQYDYTEPTEMILLSHLDVVGESD